ncbi:MAG: hypothetical protein HDR27_08775 [Lachnospiraceae bacterium]|nr:hypothetical protein [Lachnospiraceae bacterium]
MTDMKKKQKWGCMLLIWLSGIIFLMYFSYMTSPLFPKCYGWDSAFFQLVGAGMKKGYLPYRDFFDMKGPWLFFIEYAGQLLWPDRVGIFLLQCISLGSALFFCQKSYRNYFKGAGLISGLAVLIPFYIVLAPTIEGGNLTEEWSLPLVFLSLYLALDFIAGERETHKPLYGFVYGVCFGIIALIRITNAVMICAAVLTITIYLIKNKQWKNLLQNAGAFLLGVGAAFLLPLFYFGYYGEVGSMFYAVFVFGFVYGTEGFKIGVGGVFLLPLFFTIAVFLLTGQKKMRLWVLALLNTAGMMVTLGMGNSTLHDYILVIPGMMLGVWRFAESWREGQKIWKKVFLAAAFLLCFYQPFRRMAKDGLSIYWKIGNDEDYRYVTETAEYIPAEERDSVWGYECHQRWYLIADIMPYSRYCGWQEHYMQLSPQIETDIRDMMENEPPKWIVTKASTVFQNEMMIDQIEGKYALAAENEGFRLYHLKDGME